MLAYYDADEDFKMCQGFCELWIKTFPTLRADMGRILMDIMMDSKYWFMTVYSFRLKNQYYDYWKLAFDMIEHIAEINDVGMETIIATMPAHLDISASRMMMVNSTIGAVSTAKDILKKHGLTPEIVVNKYGVKEIK